MRRQIEKEFESSLQSMKSKVDTLSTEKRKMKLQIDNIKSEDVVERESLLVELNNLKNESKIIKRNNKQLE